MPPQQGDLAGVVTVVRGDLPESSVNRRSPRSVCDTNILNDPVKHGRIGVSQLGHSSKQLNKVLPCRVPLRFASRRRMLRPAFNGMIGIGRLLARNGRQIVIHPVIHVQHDLPDGMRIARNSPRRKFDGNIFDGSDWIHVCASAIHEFA